MSSLDSAASGYRGSKRAACDRCREQKTRCPRDGQNGTSDSAKCARCAKAGAVCNFSRSLRAGRPSASNSKMLAKRRERERQDANRAAPWEMLAGETREFNLDVGNQDDDFEPFLSPDGSEIWMGDNWETDLRDVTGRRRTTLPGSVPHIPKSLDPFSSRESSSIFGTEQLGFLDHPDFPNTTMSGTEDELSPMDLEPFIRNYNWNLGNPVCSSLDTMSQNHNNAANDRPTPTMLMSPETRISSASHATSDGTCTDSSAYSRTNSVEQLADTGRIPHQQTGPGETHEWERSTQPHPIIKQSASSNIHSHPDSPPAYSSPPAQDIQHRRMHELSELGLNFYSQVQETASQDDANPLELNLPDNLAVKVLESSTKFLNLLTSLYPSRSPPSPTTTADFDPFSSDEDPLTMSNTKSQNPHHTHTHHHHHQRHPLTSDYTSSTSSSTSPSPDPVDMTEVFALLTCYIRILHLHSHLYARVSSFLTTLFSRNQHLPPIFPGVQAGTVSLDHFAKFQVKLVIQISTHVLGEIEMALGLPEGYRVSKRSGARVGIFEGAVSVQFIEMTMKEKGKGGLGVERDRFACIRDHLGRLRQLLRGTINP